MTDRAAFVPTAVRTEPIQQRSTERIATLLDAAADLIDQHGIDGLTTSDVATRGGSSVGVVYRYFPNIQSLLRALADRNLEKFGATTLTPLRETTAGWAATLDLVIDGWLELLRTEPGFLAVGFGDVIDRRFVRPEHRNNSVIAAELTDLVVTKFGFALTDALSLDLELVVEIIDTLLHRAFLTEKAGDELVIARLRDIVSDQIARHAPAGVA